MGERDRMRWRTALQHLMQKAVAGLPDIADVDLNHAWCTELRADLAHQVEAALEDSPVYAPAHLLSDHKGTSPASRAMELGLTERQVDLIATRLLAEVLDSLDAAPRPSTGSVDVTPGEIHPIFGSGLDLKGLGGGHKWSSHPDVIRPRDPARLTRWRLASSDPEPVRTTIHYEYVEAVDTLAHDIGLAPANHQGPRLPDGSAWRPAGGAPFKVMVCHPSRTIDDYVVANADGNADTWLNLDVNPAVITGVTEGLQQCRSDGVPIFLAPEYTVPSHRRADVEDVLADRLLQPRAEGGPPVAPAIGVLGTGMGCACGPTADRICEDRHVATSRVWIGRRKFDVPKNRPARINGRYEAVAQPAQPRLHVFAGTTLAVAVIVCMDAFDHNIVSALYDVGVSLVLVPMATNVVPTKALDQLVAGHQSFVVLGNGPQHWSSTQHTGTKVPDGSERPIAVALGPHRDNQDLAEPQPEHPPTETGWTVLDLVKRTMLKSPQEPPIK